MKTHYRISVNSSCGKYAIDFKNAYDSLTEARNNYELKLKHLTKSGIDLYITEEDENGTVTWAEEIKGYKT